MCVIAVSEKRSLTEKEFSNCFETNSDGFGMAWIKDNKHVFVKGIMEQDEAWKCYQKNIKEVGYPHVCHFRIGTSGRNIPELTHPFIIDKKSETKLHYTGESNILFHNGVISGWQDIQNTLENKILKRKIKGDISDTRIAAIAVSFAGAEILDKIQGGKYIIFDNKNVKFYGKGWTEVNGITFSNSSYEDRKWSYYGHNSYSKYNSHNNYYKHNNNYYNHHRTNNLSQNNFSTNVIGWNDIWKELTYFSDSVDNYSINEFDKYDVIMLENENEKLKNTKISIQKEYDELKKKMLFIGSNMDSIDVRIRRNNKTIENINDILFEEIEIDDSISIVKNESIDDDLNLDGYWSQMRKLAEGEGE